MRLLKYGTVLIFLMSLWGCSSGGSSAPPLINPATGKHQTGWTVVDGTGYPPHASAANGYFKLPAGCIGCHGEKLTGGISKVSCFNNSAACHNTIPFPHPAGYEDFAVHGADAKANATTSKYYGMANCKNCHGSDYRGVAYSGADCIACHRLTNPGTNAPHAANWHGGNANGLKHSVVQPIIDTNAYACNQCHARGNNSTRKPNGAATASTPGCFTDTLCHARDVGHSNANWTTGAVHGASAKLQDAIATPADATKNGFGNCAKCHSNNAVPPRFLGGLNTSCETCHNRPGLAHPQTWVAGRGFTAGVANVASTHASGVAPSYQVCMTMCHANMLADTTVGGITYPSCVKGASLDGTARCHFSAPVSPTFITLGCKSCHTAGWAVVPATNAHATHLALAGVSCDACHFTAGNGGGSHANGTDNSATVTVTISPVYSAKTGTGSYSKATGKCSNVSCHGGITTSVDWTTIGTGAFDATDTARCLNCHEPGTTVGSPQYNSYYSGATGVFSEGLHRAHTGGGVGGYLCDACHNLSVLAASHFAALNTTVMEGPAEATIGNSVGYTLTNVVTYSKANGGQCFTSNANGRTCHTLADNFPIPDNRNRQWY